MAKVTGNITARAARSLHKHNISPGIWHHIIWKTSMDQTPTNPFQTVDIDDDANPQPINLQTYTATQTQQVPDNLGVQFQIDVNSTDTGITNGLME